MEEIKDASICTGKYQQYFTLILSLTPPLYCLSGLRAHSPPPQNDTSEPWQPSSILQICHHWCNWVHTGSPPIDPGVIKSCWQADLASLFHKWIQRAARMPYSLSVSGVGVGVLQPSASCLGTCGVGSLGAGFSTVQVIRLGMFCFFFFFQGNYYLSQMISGYRNSTLLQSLLFSALYWSICEVFWGQQG